MLPPLFENIPPELTQQPRWVLWRGNKVPYCATVMNAMASSTDPDTWASFDQAQSAYEEGGFSGVGFVLNDDGIVGVDLDKCVVDGKIDSAAISLLDTLGCTYIEFSPSGTGLRAFGYGDSIIGTSGLYNGVRVELYSAKRYLTVTGQVVRPGSLAQLHGFSAIAKELRAAPTEENRGEQKVTEDDICHLPPSSVGIPIHRFIPDDEGQRNRYLFDLARHLKGFKPELSQGERKAVVLKWHQAAYPAIGTKDFATSWGDFERGYAKVKSPFGMTMEGILHSVDANTEIPESIKRLSYGEKANRLVQICNQLQKHYGDAPFFLSARKAGELLGVHFTDAAHMLSALKTDRVIELKLQGAGKKASRYRYIWHE